MELYEMRTGAARTSEKLVSMGKSLNLEEKRKTLEANNIKYTYNIEFVDKDWNMSKEEFDDLYRQHNKWKNMRF